MPLQPDVQALLDRIAALDLPPLDSMSAEAAREFSIQLAATRPPGPDLDQIVDGVLPGPAGDLDYRAYRAVTGSDLLPVVLYFHGGGWVLGGTISDDPLCRDLAVRTGALVVSVNYRHAPEHRFPAAIDDGFAALGWVADNAASLGGDASRLAVCGWSAGGNVAAVVAQLARDAGGPSIAGQVLLTPTTDYDPTRPSMSENAEGYVLTAKLMNWFYDHYVDEADRADPRFAPIRNPNLVGLPPAFIVTCEFDPLRDEGEAYARALAAAGVDARFRRFDGHLHTTLGQVDVVPSGAAGRAAMAEALKGFLGL